MTLCKEGKYKIGGSHFCENIFDFWSYKKPLTVAEGLNTGVFIQKFGLFQFSKWLRLAKSNNHGILIVLLVLNDWTRVNTKSYSE